MIQHIGFRAAKFFIFLFLFPFFFLNLKPCRSVSNGDRGYLCWITNLCLNLNYASYRITLIIQIQISIQLSDIKILNHYSTSSLGVLLSFMQYMLPIPIFFGLTLFAQIPAFILAIIINFSEFFSLSLSLSRYIKFFVSLYRKYDKNIAIFFLFHSLFHILSVRIRHSICYKIFFNTQYNNKEIKKY